MRPEVRVGKAANLAIFLGILYTVIHLVALWGNAGSTARGFGVHGLLTALGVIGLGYGIRYSSTLCLYLATAVFTLFTLYSLNHLITASAVMPVIRCLLSGLALDHLCRSIPAMRILKATNTHPIRTSRYGEFFLRRRNR